MEYRILIVEDDTVIAHGIAAYLKSWGFVAEQVKDFRQVMEAVAALEPHLVLMDVSLPYFNGFYWCAQLRKTSAVPVIFISSRTEDMDIVMAMNTGGDDYITKPLSMEVLLAKIQAMLRRSYDYEIQQPLPRLRDAVLDAGGSCLIRDGARIELTKNEARILQLLLEKPGQIVSREAIMLRLWDSDVFVDDNTLTVNINRLRRTLREAGLGEDCITTLKGQGYSIHG